MRIPFIRPTTKFLLLFCGTLLFTGCGEDHHEHRDDATVHGDEVRIEDDRQLTPAGERRETLTDLQRMRARLIAELDAVRARLNEGSLTAEERDRQTSRAAELSQGLERLDRAILEVDQADDTTWPAVRASSRTGAEDFREWMRRNDMNDDTRG
jgi:hypothetical protein